MFGGRDDVMFHRDCLARAACDRGVSIHACALMTSRVHLLATPKGAGSLPKMVQSIGRIYVQ